METNPLFQDALAISSTLMFGLLLLGGWLGHWLAQRQRKQNGEASLSLPLRIAFFVPAALALCLWVWMSRQVF